jgi:excisionase family DNA binding protein
MMVVSDVAKKYQVSETTVNRWIAKGLPKYKIGRTVRFDETEVDAWVRDQGKEESHAN